MIDPLLRAGYRRAREVTRHHAKSFYFSSFALFGSRLRAAFALYAFCRRLDDLVDEAPPADLAQQLRRARALVSSLYGSRTALTPIAPWSLPELSATADTLERFQIPEQPLQDLISGMEMDVAPRPYETYADLDLYCYRVAGTIGLLLTPVLGFSSAAALAPAADLGRAMHLTNILRDLGEDLDRGRCYLPREDLDRFGVAEADLRAHRVDDRFVALLQFQIDRARQLYQRAASGVGFLQGFGSQRLVRTMGAIYGGILSVIERQGYDVFSARAFVPGRAKLAIALRVLLAPSTVLPAAPLALAGSAK